MKKDATEKETLRDRLLKLDDAALAAECRLDFFKASGNGGQKRNKTSSAVRLIHPETGIAVEDCRERSQHRNRAAALHKLRLALALALRQAPGAPPPSCCAVGNPDYPAWTAALFDWLAAHELDPGGTAAALGWSKSRLVRQLTRDPALWQELNRLRGAAGLPFIHP